MKNAWNTPEIEEVKISETANGSLPNNDYDGPYVETAPGQWYRPGGSTESSDVK